MKRAVLLVAMVAFWGTSAFAADIARLPDMYVEGVPGSYENDYNRGNALVASIIQGTFTDLGPAYQSALNNAGLTADLIYDPYGVWPDLDGYCLIVISTSDMWWTYDYWPQDDEILSAYMDAGGTCVVVGQDYLYTRAAGLSGFPTDYLGIAGATQDINWADEEVWWEGTPGGPLAGMTGYVAACFASNPFFTDEIVPAGTGMCWWTSASVPFPLEGGASTPVSAFSAVEFGCQETDDLNAVIGALVEWLGTPSPTKKTSWGRVKGMFRK
jgi:hypothetical protein